MVEERWRSAPGKIVVCVDSYENGVLKGQMYHDSVEPVCFESLSQFLIKMEEMQEELQQTQAATQIRKFTPVSEHLDGATPDTKIRRGAKATFEIQVIFRQHTSWQGVVGWLEQGKQERFRSALELIFLMDSVLRS